MKRKTIFAFASVLVLATSITACASIAPQSIAEDTVDVNNALHDDNGNLAESPISYEEYEKYDLIYEQATNKLFYKNETVRYFEDIYSLPDGGTGGIDFFNANGTVDVHAIRDFSNEVKNSDGSTDPAGTLTGVIAYSQQEFDARNLDELKNPKQNEALTGTFMTLDEKRATYAAYAVYGVEYDEATDSFFFDGKKVRYFLDVLSSNGEGLSSGKFVGTTRVLGSTDGTIDIYTIRDYTTLDEDGNGILTGIKAYSQKEFDERTSESGISGENNAKN